jgi:hypothetical protein
LCGTAHGLKGHPAEGIANDKKELQAAKAIILIV